MAASTLLTSLSLFLTVCTSEHHMKRQIQPRQNGDGNNTPMIVSNWCADTIYPGVVTQGGTGPQNSGFELSPGDNQTLYVSSDWQGRIWGRTNCSFNDQGKPSGGNNGRACGSGDCGGALNCKVTGDTPVTLAEWTLDGGDGQTYYDISLVDGYNLPMAIVLLPPEGNSKFSADDIPPNLTNPSCIGSVGDLAGNTSDYNPYGSGDFLGTNSQNPLPFLTNVSASDVAQWCPWDLQVSPPLSPGDGVYPYPDSNIARPVFDPCYSACAKYNSDNYCCTGKYDGPDKCSPNYFSKAAKKVRSVSSIYIPTVC